MFYVALLGLHLGLTQIGGKYKIACKHIPITRMKFIVVNFIFFKLSW